MAVKRILVVDDETSLLELVQSILEDDGYDVLLAEDGIEGLEVVNGEHPDLVITDISMPRMDGFELVRRVRSDPLVGTTPIMILSAHSDEEKKVKGLDLGADDYVSKPFGQRELVAKVRAILRRRDMIIHGKVPSAHPPFHKPGFEHLATLSFDNFIVGVGNRTAYEGTKLAAEDLGRRFNPLFIYGDPGLGKTHLMCAFANEVYQRNRDCVISYFTSEVFSEKILDAYRERRVVEFSRTLLETELLLIDDIQFLAISPSLQVVTADILSQMYDKGRQIIITSDRKPEQLQTLASEISGEFSVGLVVRVDHPDSSLRARILKSKAKQRNWKIDEEILEYLAERLDCDIRTLDGAAKRLVAMKTLSDIELNQAVADRVIEQMCSTTVSPSEPCYSKKHDTSATDTAAHVTDADTGASAGERDAEQPLPFGVEFRRGEPLKRTLDEPAKVAEMLPGGDPIPIFVSGTSNAHIIDTVEALAGISADRTPLPEGESWVYMIHADRESPQWLLLGFSDWSPSDLPLPESASPDGPLPAFIVILDGMSPKVLEARRLLRDIPKGYPAIAVVLVAAIHQYSSSVAIEILTDSMRRLFRVPDQMPLIMSGEISVETSRRWLQSVHRPDEAI